MSSNESIQTKKKKCVSVSCVSTATNRSPLAVILETIECYGQTLKNPANLIRVNFLSKRRPR